MTSFWQQFLHNKSDFWLKPTIWENFYIFWEWDEQKFLQLLSLKVFIHERNAFQTASLNQNCRVSKSKIIMCLWSVALKVRKAGNRPRTFFTGLTVTLYNTCSVTFLHENVTFSQFIFRHGTLWYSPNLLFGSVKISRLWLVVSKKLRPLYEVQLLETFQIQRLNLAQVAPEKSCRDQSCENPKRHPKNGIFHPMISWVYNNHHVNLILH